MTLATQPPGPGPAGPKILLVVATYYPDSYGGAERQAQILAQALARQGARVIIAAPTVRKDLAPTESTDFGSIERIQVRTFPNLGGRNIGSTLAWTWRLLKRFRHDRNLDAIYVFHARLHALPALLLSRALKKPLMIKLGGGGAASDFEALRAKRYIYGHAVLAGLLHGTAGFVANSAQIVADLRGLRVPTHRIFAFTNGVNIPSSEAFAAATTARTGRRLVFTGRMIEDKSVAVLFEAACRLLSGGQELQLTFLGDGPEQVRLAALAQARGLEDRILFPGVCSDVYPTLFESDFFVSASEREGQSNSLLEAMSCGCIPIVADASGASDVVTPGRTGFLVAGAGPDAFAAAIQQALALPASDRRDMSRAIREFTRDQLSVDAIAAKTLSALQTIRES